MRRMRSPSLAFGAPITAVLALAVAGALAVGCTGAGGAGKGGSSHPLARKVAPDVSLELRDGGTFRPADAKGKVVVMDFWATWCAPCKASFPKVDAIFQKHKDQGLVVVGVNEDEERGGIDAFLANTGAKFPIAYDAKGKAAEVFGVDTMPSSFVIDRRGVVRFVHSGYHPDDASAIEAEVEQLLAESP